MADTHMESFQNELDTYYANQDRNAAAEEAAVDEQIGEDGLAEPLSDTIMDGVEGEGADGGIAEGTAALNEAEDDLDLEQELSKALADLSSDDEDDEEVGRQECVISTYSSSKSNSCHHRRRKRTRSRPKTTARKRTLTSKMSSKTMMR